MMNLSVVCCAGALVALGPCPRGDRMTAARGPAFTTAVRVVDRVLGDAAGHRTLASQRLRAGLRQVGVPLSGFDTAPTVPCSPNGCSAAHPRTDGSSPCRGRDRPAAHRCPPNVPADRPARLHLHIVDDGADRHLAQFHGVARLHVGALAGDDDVAGARRCGARI